VYIKQLVDNATPGFGCKAGSPRFFLTDDDRDITDVIVRIHRYPDISYVTQFRIIGFDRKEAIRRVFKRLKIATTTRERVQTMSLFGETDYLWIVQPRDVTLS
jgi:hypothetical protein